MAGHFIKSPDGGVMHYTCADIYRYRGFTFEFHRYCGFFKLNKDLESSARSGRKFWKTVTAWQKLTPSKKKRTLIYS